MSYFYSIIAISANCAFLQIIGNLPIAARCNINVSLKQGIQDSFDALNVFTWQFVPLMSFISDINKLDKKNLAYTGYFKS